MREREKEEEEEEEEEEDYVRGPEEEVWGDGGCGVVPPPEEIESRGDDNAGGGFSGEASSKRKRDGGGGGGKKAARGTNQSGATTATAATPSFTSSYRGVYCLPSGALRWKAQFQHSGIHAYLGHFEAEEGAARAYDRMVVWCYLRGLAGKRLGGGGKGAVGLFLEDLNFKYAEYKSEVEELVRIPLDELVLKLRRGEGKCASASSKFRGVSWVRARGRGRGRWQAQFKHNSKTTCLGCSGTEVGAARAHDRMMVWFKLHEVERKGGTATNFAHAEYKGEVEELGRLTQAELVAKLRLQARAGREGAVDAEGDEASEIGGAELGGAEDDEGGVEGEGEGDNHSLDDVVPMPHPNAPALVGGAVASG
jgi:hypothetical protein